MDNLMKVQPLIQQLLIPVPYLKNAALIVIKHAEVNVIPQLVTNLAAAKNAHMTARAIQLNVINQNVINQHAIKILYLKDMVANQVPAKKVLADIN